MGKMLPVLSGPTLPQYGLQLSRYLKPGAETKTAQTDRQDKTQQVVARWRFGGGGGTNER